MVKATSPPLTAGINYATNPIGYNSMLHIYPITAHFPSTIAAPHRLIQPFLDRYYSLPQTACRWNQPTVRQTDIWDWRQACKNTRIHRKTYQGSNTLMHNLLWCYISSSGIDDMLLYPPSERSERRDIVMLDSVCPSFCHQSINRLRRHRCTRRR